jgi:hydroxyacylglutathione hydrolase
MSTYLASLEKVKQLGLKAIAPGHGELIEDPIAKIDEYVTHRLAREETVAAALAAQACPVTVAELLPVAYADVDEAHQKVATFSLWAHLQKLVVDGRATAVDPEDLQTSWLSVP